MRPPTFSRPHRQALATLALIGFTVMPTGYVALTAWKVNRPDHVREVEAELGRQLGLRVTIESVRHPRPGEDVLGGVVCRQEEAKGAEVARAASVRVHRGNRQLALEVDGLRLHGEGPRQAMGQLSALLQRLGGSDVDRVSLSARDCRLELGADAPQALIYRFRDVAGFVQPGPDGPTLTVSYHVPLDQESADTTTRCELTVTRTHQDGPARTTLAFKTMEGLPLPARVLDPFFDSGAWLGSSARVRGALTLRQAASTNWEAEFQGEFVDLDLSALVGRRFSDHRLTGLARVTIARARWADRPGAQGFGWVEADGELTAGPGTIGVELIRALRSEMKFLVAAQLDRQRDRADVPFQGLGLKFAMNRTGELRLAGGLGVEFPPGAVLVDRQGLDPLASAPEGAANVRGLVRTLFPTPNTDPTALVPDTPESRILQVLPVPLGTTRRTDLMSN